MREKLIELLGNSFDKQYSKRGLLTAPHTADDLIANGVVVSKMETTTKWIPVTERLPELNDKEPDWSVTVLFRTTQGYIHSGYRNIGRQQRSFYDDDWTPPYWLDESEDLSFEEEEVTHWMPLPEPPKGE